MASADPGGRDGVAVFEDGRRGCVGVVVRVVGVFRRRRWWWWWRLHGGVAAVDELHDGGELLVVEGRAPMRAVDVVPHVLDGAGLRAGPGVLVEVPLLVQGHELLLQRGEADVRELEELGFVLGLSEAGLELSDQFGEACGVAVGGS